MTPVDLSPHMLAQSRRLNPDCRHLTGDMRSLRPGQRFDAISHMTTEADLLATMHTARAHRDAGGVALFCPDWTLERFAPGTSTGGSDRPDRGMRYLEWTHPITGRATWETDLVYLLREAYGTRRAVQDRIVLGLFSRGPWTRLLATAGFGQVAIADPSGRDLFRAFAI